jgi:hypothetical protein
MRQLVMLLLMLSASAAVAQTEDPRADVNSPGLTIEALAGWDGTVDRSRPIPVSFLLSNLANTPIEGRLMLIDVSRQGEIDLGEVFLVGGGTRRFASVQMLADWFECFAELRHSEEVLWRRELTLTTGMDFNADQNFALIISDSQRVPDFPNAASKTVQTTTSDQTVASESGPVRYLSVKSWQVPDHPGPMIAVQTIIFPEDFPPEDLNGAQWQAIAEWMCQGGAVFIHDKSSEIIQQLIRSAPLRDELPLRSEPFEARRIGLGTLYEYAAELYSDSEGSSSTRQQIADIAAKLTKHHIHELASAIGVYNQGGGRADRNRFFVVGFFLLYTLFSGLVALTLVRANRRKVTVYLVTVVASACVLSVVLGGILRTSTGDVHWVTVTQAAAGGAVQIGKLDLHSAGSRNTRIAIRGGGRPDLQFTKRIRYYGYGRHDGNGYPPFSWQPNLAMTAEDVYQISDQRTDDSLGKSAPDRHNI